MAAEAAASKKRKKDEEVEHEEEEEDAEKAAAKAAKKAAKKKAEMVEAMTQKTTNELDEIRAAAKAAKKLARKSDKAEEAAVSTTTTAEPWNDALAQVRKEEPAEPVDPVAAKAAKKAARKKAKRERLLARKTPEQLEKRVEEVANREAMNKGLRVKGKLTKKQIYLKKKFDLKANILAKAKEAASSKKASIGEQAELDPNALDCFLTGLPYMATEKHIEDHFRSIGPCSAEVLREAESKKSKGTAFISFQTAQRAVDAVSFGQGSKLQGRWIGVRLAEVRNGNTGVRKAQAEVTDFDGEIPAGCLSVVVTKLARDVTDDDLWKFFEGHRKECKVENVSRLMHKESGDFRGMAFVDFKDTRSVGKAIKKNGTSVNGRACFIRFKLDKPEDGDAGPKEPEVEEHKKSKRHLLVSDVR